MHFAKRTLVFGGAGFLGSHLCDRLIAHGHIVICADNLETGQMSNIAHLLKRPNFRWLHHDVADPVEIEVDEIYNLACPASPIHYQRDPIKTVRTSVLGAMNLLALASRLKVPILQASTSEVYGDPDRHPQSESYNGSVNCTGPRACYDEGKRCAETLFFDYQRQGRADVRVARIFNTYGPRMHPDDGRVVSNFIVQALRNEPITVYGDGSQTRSFCYVDDLIDGLIRLMGHRTGPLGPVNLGNPDEMTVAELAELIVYMTCSRSYIRAHPLPEDDPTRRRPDIARAAEMLGWRPKVSLDEGLKSTIAYFECRISRDSAGGAVQTEPVSPGHQPAMNAL